MKLVRGLPELIYASLECGEEARSLKVSKDAAEDVDGATEVSCTDHLDHTREDEEKASCK